MMPYIKLDKVKVTNKKEVEQVYTRVSVSSDNPQLLYHISRQSGKDITQFINILKDNINVEYIKP